MADSKITALDNLTSADPANDMIPIVDVSATPPASGNTKRISINNLLACSPSATLASATITGDLTVDTNVLKVDTTLNRVGIGTASPTQALHVRGNILTGSAAGTDSFLNVTTDGVQNSLFGFNNSGSTNGYGASNNNTYIGSGNNYGLQIIGNSSVLASFSTSGVFNWFDGAGGTRMTLNSGGLAIGTTTNYGKLSVAGSIASFASNTIGAVSANSGYVVYSAYAGAGAYISFQPTNSSGTQFEAARIDSNGNLILSSSTVPATLASDYQLTLNATSNTNLRFSYRGSDGVTRVANITLA